MADVGDGDRAAHLRPTSDRVRENLFNLLVNGASGNLVAGARVLDLCAGTGALGLEALSRGAVFAAFVDDGKVALSLIRQNARLCGVEGQSEILTRDVLHLGANPLDRFDLVLLDPPYGRDFAAEVLPGLAAGGWLAEDALIVVEDNVEQFARPGFSRRDHRRYGETHIHLFEMT